jgi:hypothetical protein
MTSPGYNFNREGGALQKGTGHFTQLVWKSTTHVGAALSSCGRFLVCNYAPAGNVMRLYKVNVAPPSKPAE